MDPSREDKLTTRGLPESRRQGRGGAQTEKGSDDIGLVNFCEGVFGYLMEITPVDNSRVVEKEVNGLPFGIKMGKAGVDGIIRTSVHLQKIKLII